ncbi:hypothetical protein E2562_025956 [Oryza meyeriana var. granulata]|uniref:Uncharacterized protein n=1 Tax=Oryza meyeriana var. granulata TaxID=110450 RepID=A0A6G1EYY4_9ORYZ|nr:hypothetical protein E2562_025956 [Oryza meyeriana var. granulata]
MMCTNSKIGADVSAEACTGGGVTVDDDDIRSVCYPSVRRRYERSDETGDVAPTRSWKVLLLEGEDEGGALWPVAFSSASCRRRPCLASWKHTWFMVD